MTWHEDASSSKDGLWCYQDEDYFEIYPEYSKQYWRNRKSIYKDYKIRFVVSNEKILDTLKKFSNIEVKNCSSKLTDEIKQSGLLIEWLELFQVEKAFIMLLNI